MHAPTKIRRDGSTLAPENRAALISKSLKAAARQARTPLNIWVPVRVDTSQRWRHIFALAVNRHGELARALGLPVFAAGAGFAGIEVGELPEGPGFDASALRRTN